MKSKIIAALKIVLPLGFGIFIIWLFYDALCEDQKDDLFSAFGKANYWWVLFGLTMGLLSHISRAYRWKYLLEPMGYKPRLIQLYNAVMIGYLVNLVFPRAGEASRAGVLDRTEGVPFQKGFGTIIAERAVDLVMLGIIVLITLSLQSDKIQLFQDKADELKGGIGCGNSEIFGVLGTIVGYGIILAVAAAAIMFVAKKSFREKIRSFIRGIFEGLFSIFKTKHKLAFIGHTLFIWAMYIVMLWTNFMAISETSELGFDAIFSGFLAGALAIILVQGGIGVYPAFVGIIVTIYMPGSPDGIAPAALAMGWLAWTSQTIMLIIMGLLSFALNRKNPNLVEQSKQDESTV